MHIPRNPQSSDFETSPILSFGEVSKALIEQLSAYFQSDAADGTDAALNTITLGAPADSEQCSRRGGARNSAARESHALSTAQIANLIAAKAYAAQIGLPLNRMITIHWEAAGVPLEGMTKATGRFVDLLTKTLARHGSQTACLWVHEGGEDKGGHCHLLIHVPANLVPKIIKLQRGWLRRITNRPYKANVIHSAPVGGRLGVETGSPSLHAANLEVALNYLIKGADDAAAMVHGLERIQHGGLVIGKRCGTSQNIGPKARKSAELSIDKGVSYAGVRESRARLRVI